MLNRCFRHFLQKFVMSNFENFALKIAAAMLHICI